MLLQTKEIITLFLERTNTRYLVERENNVISSEYILGVNEVVNPNRILDDQLGNCV